jgi:hypothetical protein
MHGTTSIERRVLRLEETLEKTLRDLANVKNKVGQVSEDGARNSPDIALGGRIFWHGQAVGTIAARSGYALGTGTVRLLQDIGGSLYKVKPIADGDVTVPAVQNTGGTIADKTLLYGAYIDGEFNILEADCSTPNASDAPDPP